MPPIIIALANLERRQVVVRWNGLDDRLDPGVDNEPVGGRFGIDLCPPIVYTVCHRCVPQ